VGDRETPERYLNSASKNTPETDIFPQGTKLLLASVIGQNATRIGLKRRKYSRKPKPSNKKVVAPEEEEEEQEQEQEQEQEEQEEQEEEEEDEEEEEVEEEQEEEEQQQQA
jgi:hypothetical protein